VGGISTRATSRSSGNATRGQELTMTTTRGDQVSLVKRLLSCSGASLEIWTCVTNPGMDTTGNLGKSQASSGLGSGLGKHPGDEPSANSDPPSDTMPTPLGASLVGDINTQVQPIGIMRGSDGPMTVTQGDTGRPMRPPPRLFPLLGQQQRQQYQAGRGRDPSLKALSCTQHQVQLHHL